MMPSKAWPAPKVKFVPQADHTVAQKVVHSQG